MRQALIGARIRIGGALTRRPAPNNDNNPGRVTKYVTHNGGCSTVSGPVGISLARVPTIDGRVAA